MADGSAQIATEQRPTASETLPGLLATAAERFGDRLWMTYEGETRTFAELQQDVRQIAGALDASGVEAGDRVGLFAANCLEWLEIEYATASIGGAMVPLNTWQRSRELEHIFDRTNLTTLIWGGKVLGRETIGLLGELLPELDGAKPGAWQSERFPRLKTVIGIGDGPWPLGVIGWDDFIAAAPDDLAVIDAKAEAVGPDDPALVIFTSGTTGLPKGAVLQHRQMLDHMRVWAEAIELTPDDHSIMASPLFWVFGCVINAVVALEIGSSINLLERFEAKRFLRALTDEGVTHLQGMPTQYELALAEATEDDDLSGIRLIQIGGSASAVGLAGELLRRAPDARMISGYGLTEASGCNLWTALGDPIEDLASSVGRVSADMEGTLRDPATGAEVPRGEVGELWLRGNGIMIGYIEDLEATAKTLVDGWLRTGDLMVQDERGYHSVVGRSVDAFKRGGMNVYPAETEAVLSEHPAIQFSSVIGVPDERLGEVGAAYVVLEAGAELEEQELIDWCAKRISAYKVPAYVRIVDELPRTPTGKAQKFKLRAMWAESSPAQAK